MTEKVWTCVEERFWMYWEQEAKDGAARRQEDEVG